MEACAELHEQVQIKNVLGTLIDHLALYAVAEDSPGIPDDIHLFEIFSQHAEQVIGTRTEMPTEHIISIQVFIIKFYENQKILDCFIEPCMLSRQARIC